ncbi:Response regulator receiver modulated diguanylate cyclase/phosphodiesterase [Planktothrix serta PCC 8927]|uniref:Response regulator receiver modulated diguanylate cyclase/phosphodiesterase n=1 Tax=Planktothrix serta PCC 8927 TaxID=671068 RepID=A0A7Z9BZ64_9CYAN|nr:EAL domain-containing protein [Planktothrix serta]VXD24848.1 Response regulator receiver modulated diguanylate cyclase/phosphodiesterase [Planktothrix serta PCC 8927]
MNNSLKPKHKILIIDDNPINVELLFEYLNYAGFEVWKALDGKSGLEIITQNTPDLILLDVMIPDLDGFEICTRLKANPAYAEIPIIFTTALAESQQKVKGLNLGAVDYITKPFDQREILARINLHLRLHTLNSQLKQEIHEKKQVEQALNQLNLELENRVEERTSQLQNTLQELQQAQQKLLEREQQLHHKAYHDLLTGLPNRAWCIHQLKTLIAQAKSDSNYRYAVLFLDLDRFNVVNDSLGHLLGDQLLQQVAQRLQSCLTSDLQIARLGGDEFVILIENITDDQEVITIAHQILDLLSPVFKLNQYEVYTGVSIGITFSDFGYDYPEDILRDVDVAMYSAKANGKGCYQLLTSELQQKAMSRLQLENDLRRAIQNQEFSLYYQPILSLPNSNKLGFEALIRWHHPKKGMIPPDQFIPVAEETGLIIELGLWVIKTALNQISIWQEKFPCFSEIAINVNVSPQQLMIASFSEQVQDLLSDFNIKSHQIKFEITESSLLRTGSHYIEVLKRLKSLGIQFCIDDFGMGYSSLSRLHEFPIDTLKIDRSFIRRIGSNQGEIELIRTIITLAHGLGMDVVAEGIETKSQLNQLSLLGCEWGQGFLFSKPLNSVDATQYIAALLTTPRKQERVKALLM